jgi:hypothetical protein
MAVLMGKGKGSEFLTADGADWADKGSVGGGFIRVIGVIRGQRVWVLSRSMADCSVLMGKGKRVGIFNRGWRGLGG